MEQFIEKQLNESYNGKLNELFKKWQESYEENQRYLFCQDGLVVKNKDENSGYDINRKWDEAERKIMFIVKDCPNEWGYDARRLFVGYPDNEKSLKNAENVRKVKGRGVFLRTLPIFYTDCILLLKRIKVSLKNLPILTTIRQHK